MKVLVIGSGGREHALVWDLAASSNVTAVFAAPGNTGTALEPKTQNIPIPVTALFALRDFAKEKQIDLTIVGPEVPLVAGIVDLFKEASLSCFGPSRYCAQLEGSKAFAKAFLKRYHIPTAAYATFDTLQEALAHVQARPLPMVIKADGLAAGKGVFIAHTREEATHAVQQILGEQHFGTAGASIVVEDFLIGEEASFIVMSDGKNVLSFPTAQDHKARDNGDLGPNTGGMGAYSPAPVVTPDLHQKILDTVIFPTLKGMEAEGHPFVGFLYAGLMISQGGCHVLEFNCRLGDPEAQPLLMRLNSCLASLCLAALAGTLDKTPCSWDSRPALGVVLTNHGYPEQFQSGDVIDGLGSLASIPDLKVFHAGTAFKDNRVVAAGGRVLTVTALGKTLESAQAHAYRAIEHLSWPHLYYRTDIGFKAFLHLPKEQCLS